MKYLIYQSPKKERRQSAPIAESNVRARATLEAQGWTVVAEQFDAAEPAGDVASETPLADAAMTADADVLSSFDFLNDDQRQSLRNAGWITEAQFRAATDAELRDVAGIGPGALRNIRAALTS